MNMNGTYISGQILSNTDRLNRHKIIWKVFNRLDPMEVENFIDS